MRHARRHAAVHEKGTVVENGALDALQLEQQFVTGIDGKGQQVRGGGGDRTRGVGGAPSRHGLWWLLSLHSMWLLPLLN